MYILLSPAHVQGYIVIQNILMAFRDYDPVALTEHYCPVNHPKLSRAGIGDEAGVPASDGRRTLLVTFFYIRSGHEGVYCINC
ncbi:hypothetical protein EHW33_00600 [Salmonella enterica]|nr:hypothetical protein [Salmonella enterica]ECT6436810.1 hypothetical protein [Salmonella enterica subsp. enterica]ECU6336741.1 hypothetical protein [Salmonella enterica subsp. enterica serovar Worthington]EAB3939148.1 hypothetical protein [Salmonella enterica]EAM5427103.1 hypothetical protein [Salmonella enterica]